MGTSAQIIELARLSGIPNTPGSTYRPGATTASGRASWHASDQAVDFTGHSQDQLAAFFMQFPTLEVIHHSDATGRNYASSGGTPYDLTRNPELLQQHRDHLHVAMSPAQLGAGSILDQLKRAGGAIVGALGNLPFVPNPENITQAVGNLASGMRSVADSALSVGQLAQAVTKVFLPSNLIRAFALFMGTILILIGIWFLAREVRESS